MILPKKALKNYRRYRGYDYSRGATLCITISTEPRQAIFGRVFDDRIELNAFGLAAEETFRLEEQRNPALHVMAFVIMPDHVHFMIHVRAGERSRCARSGSLSLISNAGPNTRSRNWGRSGSDGRRIIMTGSVRHGRAWMPLRNTSRTIRSNGA